MNDTLTELSCSLLADGSLGVSADVWTETQVRHWLPHLPETTAVSESAACIEVSLRKTTFGTSAIAPDLVLGPLRASLFASGRGITLHAHNHEVSGTIDFVQRSAAIHVAPNAARQQPRNASVFSALTLSSAFLLNRMHRALLHAAAVVSPDGSAWLLVGDALAGKTTTTVNLIRAGWDYLSDDHVILERSPDGAVMVEGWPRAFHLDRGFDEGISLGERDAIDPTAIGPGQWRRTARLAAVLFPQVVSDQPTRLRPLAAADALTRVIRQSPWLIGDRETAHDVLALLRDAVARTTFHISLGRDAYTSPERLLDALRPAMQPA